jgi:hypothetical protein
MVILRLRGGTVSLVRENDTPPFRQVITLFPVRRDLFAGKLKPTEAGPTGLDVGDLLKS